MSSVFTTKSTTASFGGQLLKLSHKSTATGCDMAVNVYLPPAALGPSPPKAKVPVLIWLSGLTCTPDNATEKAFFQHAASRRGLAVVYPDTSPRGLGVAGESDSWDFGVGAGFYVDATRPPWVSSTSADNLVGWRMETYVARELPTALAQDADLGHRLDLGVGRVALAGHSMGGHGALTLYLKDPTRWASASAFAPIANPCACPWGQKAFAGYLGEDRDVWKRHDATELVRAWNPPAGSGSGSGDDVRILVDQGTADAFYKQGQLLPEKLEQAVADKGLKGFTMRYHEGYDHSYFFMASFSDEHIDYAAKHLGLL